MSYNTAHKTFIKFPKITKKKSKRRKISVFLKFAASTHLLMFSNAIRKYFIYVLLLPFFLIFVAPL